MIEYKTKLGILCIILAFVSPLFGFVVPFLGLSKALSATLVGFFALGMPEIFLLIGGLLAGKEVVNAITERVKKMIKSRLGASLLLVVLYISLMAVGMYLMHHYFGYIYGTADMVKVLWAVEILLLLVSLYFAGKLFGWSDIGFGRLEKRHLVWLLPPLGFLAYEWMGFAQSARYGSFEWALLGLVALTTLLVGISEELVFRGMLLHSLRDKYSAIAAVLLSSILFSLLHAVNIFGGSSAFATAIQLVMTFIFGLFLGALALKLKNIIPLIIFHFLWDFTIFGVSMAKSVTISFLLEGVLLAEALILILILAHDFKKTLVKLIVSLFALGALGYGTYYFLMHSSSFQNMMNKIGERAFLKANKAYFKTIPGLPEDLNSSLTIIGDPNSDTVIINTQGGPTTESTIAETLMMVKDDARIDLNKTLLVDVKQYQSLHQDLFKEREITFEQAIEYDAKSVDLLAKSIKYFKSKGKKVYLLGISFGAFMVEGLLLHHGDIADRYYIVVGRMNMPSKVWKSFSHGVYVGFKYSEDGKSFEIVKFDSSQAGMGGGSSIEDHNMARLAAGLGHIDFTKDLSEMDLSRVLYVYGYIDEQVGRLTDKEIAFLRGAGAKVIKINSTHSGTIDRFMHDYIRSDINNKTKENR